MRRLKIVVYLLILGILSSLLGNVSFAWASTQDKLTITEIYDLDLVSVPCSRFHFHRWRREGNYCKPE